MKFQHLATWSILIYSTLSENVQRWDQNSWPSPVYGHTLSLISLYSSSDNYAIKIGGWPWYTDNITYVEILDLQNFTWFQLSVPFTPPSRHYHSAVSNGNSVWIFGGKRGNTFLNDLYYLDASTLIWTEVDACSLECPDGRYGHSAVLLQITRKYNNMVIFGGLGVSNQLFDDVWVLNINGTNAVWSKVNAGFDSSLDVPSARFFHSSVLYRYGGTSDGVAPLQDSYLYMLDLSSISWATRIQSEYSGDSDFFTHGIFGATAVLAESTAVGQSLPELLIIFSCGYSNGYTSEVVVYRLFSNSWVVLDNNSIGIDYDVPTPRSNLASVFTQNFFVQFGGSNETPTSEMNVLQFNFNYFELGTVDYLDSSTNPFEAFWTSIYISSFDFNINNGLMSVLLHGWGFSNNTYEQFNSVQVYSFENPYDSSSTNLNLNDYADCIVSNSSFNEVGCITQFLPVGYFVVVANVVDLYGNTYGTAFTKGFSCSRKRFSMVSAQSETSVLSVCVPVPIVTSFSPTSGYAGNVITFTGSNLGNYNDLNNITIGDTPCIIQSASSSQVKCAVGSSSTTNAGVLFSVSSTVDINNDTYLYQVPVNFETPAAFNYIFYLQRISSSVNEANGTYTATFSFGGYGFDESTYISIDTQFLDQNGQTVFSQPCALTGIFNQTFSCSMTVNSWIGSLNAKFNVKHDSLSYQAYFTACDIGSYLAGSSGNFVPVNCIVKSLIATPSLVPPVTQVKYETNQNTVKQYQLTVRTLVATQAVAVSDVQTLVATQSVLVPHVQTLVATHNIVVPDEKTVVQSLKTETIALEEKTKTIYKNYLSTVLNTLRMAPGNPLADTSSTPSQFQIPTYWSIVIIGILLLLIVIVIVFCLHRRHKERDMYKVHDWDATKLSNNDYDEVVREESQGELNYAEGSRDALNSNK